jgi:hypothetical protein
LDRLVNWSNEFLGRRDNDRVYPVPINRNEQAASGSSSTVDTVYRSCGTFFISREAATAEQRYEKERQSGSYMHMAAFSARTYLISLSPPFPPSSHSPL